jgi:hypothetical protein
VAPAGASRASARPATTAGEQPRSSSPGCGSRIKGRIRKIAIVALARKLMVALWRYLQTGLIPTGAVMRPSL